MHKNDRFTFEKYSVSHWPASATRARAYTYVPDEIFEPVLSTLQAYAPQILNNVSLITLESLKASRTEWSWGKTMDAVRAAWDHIDPALGAHMAHAIDDAVFRPHDVARGRGDGQCFSDVVEIGSDKTINDPVCAIHESGHLMAFMRAPDRYNDQPAENIKEIQAMFVQEHGYAHLMLCADDEAAENEVRLHRLAYYTGILSRVPICMVLLEQEKSKPCNVIEEFNRWSIDPAMIGHLSRADQGQRPSARKLHMHPFAAMLAPALYKRFDAQEPDEKRRILKVLYEGGPETTLVDVLGAFGIEKPEDMKAVAEYTCRNFAAEIKAVEVVKPRTAPVLVPI